MKRFLRFLKNVWLCSKKLTDDGSNSTVDCRLLLRRRLEKIGCTVSETEDEMGIDSIHIKYRGWSGTYDIHANAITSYNSNEVPMRVTDICTQWHKELSKSRRVYNNRIQAKENQLDKKIRADNRKYKKENHIDKI